MGNYISSLRTYLSPSNRAGGAAGAGGIADSNSSSSQPTQTTTIHPASSRLNLINQLNGLGGLAGTSRRFISRKSGSLNDFNNVSFASHFFMAGRRFKNIITQAQTFLFGDQLDLGFLIAHKPILFPYEIAPIDVPSNYLQSLINIRKDTLKLVKCVNSTSSRLDQQLENNNSSFPHQPYTIEFVFDNDCDCTIKIHYFATESYRGLTSNDNNNSINGGGGKLTYMCGCAKFYSAAAAATNHMSDGSLNQSPCCCYESRTYKKGAGQVFKLDLEHSIIPSRYQSNAWQFNLHANYFPVVIECRPVDARLRDSHAHITLAYVEKTTAISTSAVPKIADADTNTENSTATTTAAPIETQTSTPVPPPPPQTTPSTPTYQIKPIKQKQLINGVLFCLQEIYGIERKVSLSNDDGNEQQSTSLPNIKLPCLSESGENTTTTNTDTQNSSSSTTTTNGGDPKTTNSEQDELKGIECVICMCEMRDTLILPCRHFCLCKTCAVNLRVQSNNCPICRHPFLALIQLKLFRRRQNPQPKHQTKQRKTHMIMHLNRIDETQSTGRDRDDNLPTIKFDQDDENDNEAAVRTTQATTIIGEANRDVLLSASPQQRTCLGDFYECVSVYEAFNGLLQQSSEHEREAFFAEKRRRSLEANRRTSKTKLAVDNTGSTNQTTSAQINNIERANNISGIEIKTLHDLRNELDKLSVDIVPSLTTTNELDQETIANNAAKSRQKLPYQSSSVVIGSNNNSNQKIMTVAKSLDDLAAVKMTPMATTENICLHKLEHFNRGSNESIHLDSTSKF